MDDDLRLAELLAALSVATDLGMGHEPEKAVRSCLLATELARSLSLPEPQVRDVYYTSMLQHLGCTAPGLELTRLFGDDREISGLAERTDDARLRGALTLLALAGRGTGSRRLAHLGRVVASGRDADTTILRSVCEVGTRMAERLHLGDGVRAALADSTEIWDGTGGAYRRSADEICLPARVTLVATQAVIFDRLAGPDAAVDVVRDRAGHWFDPDVAARFVRDGPSHLRHIADADVWTEVLAVEPRPVTYVPASRVDDIAHVFADMVDLKDPFTLGHSPDVASLATHAAERLGFSADQIATLRRAGLLHDLGRVAVSGGVWARRRELTTAQWEQVRLHPYHTQRILERSAALRGAAGTAGMHHERLDGSGYHHGVGGSSLAPEARLLAAADAYQAMTQARPHRPALEPEQAAAQLHLDAAAGRFDVECVRGVLEAAGHEPGERRRCSWPAGLTDREVEVLRLVARGSSNREIATALVISRRTAEHHVQHIYAKIGVSTRAAAALFTVEHGLLR